MQSGITFFESSMGGLGGCPFAPGAAGNASTEDLLSMLAAMDIRTNVNFEAYMRAVAYARENIPAPLTGHMVSACAKH